MMAYSYNLLLKQYYFIDSLHFGPPKDMTKKYGHKDVTTFKHTHMHTQAHTHTHTHTRSHTHLKHTIYTEGKNRHMCPLTRM